MKEYESVYIANPDLTDAQVAQLNDRIKDIVEKDGGRFFYARSMGKRRLAYRVAKFTKGIYFCVDFAAEGSAVTEIERMYRLNEDVVRFLTVVKADDVDIEARLAEIAARGEDKPPASVTEPAVDAERAVKKADDSAGGAEAAKPAAKASGEENES